MINTDFVRSIKNTIEQSGVTTANERTLLAAVDGLLDVIDERDEEVHNLTAELSRYREIVARMEKTIDLGLEALGITEDTGKL